MTEPSTATNMLMLLNQRHRAGTPIYTRPPQAEVDRRRTKNKAARKARRNNR